MEKQQNRLRQATTTLLNPALWLVGHEMSETAANKKKATSVTHYNLLFATSLILIFLIGIFFIFPDTYKPRRKITFQSRKKVL